MTIIPFQGMVVAQLVLLNQDLPAQVLELINQIAFRFVGTERKWSDMKYVRTET